MIQVVFLNNQVSVSWNSSLHFVEFKFASKESSLRFVESSSRLVESSLHQKNQVFVNACELHRTRYVDAICVVEKSAATQDDFLRSHLAMIHAAQICH